MYATKRPTLRIDQSDLKCRSGCGFFGNAEWEGYCSKCYKEYVKNRREVHVSEESTPTNKSHISGFSKFEEKKRLQTDKRNKYLKSLTPVFRKSSSSKESLYTEKNQLRHANPDVEKLLAEHISFFGTWGQDVREDFLKCSYSVYTKVISEIDCKTIEEIADLVQRYYTRFSEHLHNSPVYQHVNPKVKEQIFDFFEKFVMVNLYSVLFCPYTTADEEKDLFIQERIRKLSWVNANHLGCCISETSMEVRELVYSAITELLGIDSVKAPQEKLLLIVKCSKSIMEVLQHCQGGPVSADEFLPALIFIVLKANPARLKSNINYITRFCNAQQLMQGEGGYYFTNLCCAVSFIESLTAESLNMPEKEFTAYMNGSITPVSAWESALVACESMHQLCEHLTHLKNLSDRIETVKLSTKNFKDDVEKFKNDICKKVSGTLKHIPLIIKPQILPEILSKEGLFGKINHKWAETKSNMFTEIKENLDISSTFWGNTQIKSSDLPINVANANLDDEKSSSELQFSINASEESLQNYVGTSNLACVSYDIDLSDLSIENSSLVEDRALKKPNCDLFTPEDKLLNPCSSPSEFTGNFDLTNDSEWDSSVIDNIGEIDTANLPSPLKPTTSYFEVTKMGRQIPNIPCITGEFNSFGSPETESETNDLN